ncbi:hypothetical protein RIF29_29255 [Crotalaria pallida]|uniref:Uncharacterized protein n=1 Tax=Crotalaria pallida TaxID=3830 RepID=A0AAN9HVR5_CROPI
MLKLFAALAHIYNMLLLFPAVAVKIVLLMDLGVDVNIYSTFPHFLLEAFILQLLSSSIYVLVTRTTFQKSKGMQVQIYEEAQENLSRPETSSSRLQLRGKLHPGVEALTISKYISGNILQYVMLLKAAVVLGAIMGGGTDEEIERLRKYARLSKRDFSACCDAYYCSISDVPFVVATLDEKIG